MNEQEIRDQTERQLAQSYKRCFWSSLVLFVIVVWALLMLSGCGSTKVVTVPEVHEQHHWHTDSIHHTDSIISERETTIMQLDSAAMARYGIQLKQAERAWLVRTSELERQIERLQAMSMDRDTIRDTIPKPYAIIEYEEKPLSWGQQTLQTLGWLMLAVIGAGILFLIFKIKK